MEHIENLPDHSDQSEEIAAPPNYDVRTIKSDWHLIIDWKSEEAERRSQLDV